MSWFVANVTPFWKFEFGLITHLVHLRFCCLPMSATWCQVSIVLHAAAQLAFQGRQELFEKLLESPAWDFSGCEINITLQQGGFFGRYVSFFGRVLQKVSMLDSKIVFFCASSAFVCCFPIRFFIKPRKRWNVLHQISGTSGSGKAIFRRGIWRSASMLRPRCVSWGVTKPCTPPKN